MALKIDSKKWILYRHISDFNLLCSVAEFLKSYSKTAISKEEKTRLNLKLREVGLYSERNPDMPLDAINHKINQLSYYMLAIKRKLMVKTGFYIAHWGIYFSKTLKTNTNPQKYS